VLDHCLCTISRAPHSYTGENTAELHCHGSPAVLREALATLFAAGARQAAPGEFTRRAFLNGRIDLSQAEAVIDLIEAETTQAAVNAAGQLGGAVLRKTGTIYRQLVDIAAHFHAVLDYPDEDIEPFTLAQYADTLTQASRELRRLYESFDRGRHLRRGVPTAILGRPNAGKSTLLNALLGYERAIVTDIPGTTRDTITESVEVGGVLLRLTDTAGLRETTDAAEALGVERSRETAQQAELVLALMDPGDVPGQEDRLLWDIVRDARYIIVVLTKADLYPADAAVPDIGLPGGRRPDAVLRLSAATGQGMETLESAVAALYPAGFAPAGEILTNARQAEAVGRALDAVDSARRALADGVTPDAVLTEAEAAMSALGELSGRSLRADVTEQIFSRFCVGK